MGPLLEILFHRLGVEPRHWHSFHGHPGMRTPDADSHMESVGVRPTLRASPLGLHTSLRATLADLQQQLDSVRLDLKCVSQASTLQLRPKFPTGREGDASVCSPRANWPFKPVITPQASLQNQASVGTAAISHQLCVAGRGPRWRWDHLLQHWPSEVGEDPANDRLGT